MRVKVTTPDGMVTYERYQEQPADHGGNIMPISFTTMATYPAGSLFEVEEEETEADGARCPRCREWKPKGSMRICCM